LPATSVDAFARDIDEVGAQRTHQQVEPEDDRRADREHPESLDREVRYDPVVHIHREERRDEREQIDQQGGDQRFPVDRPALRDGTPEPVPGAWRRARFAARVDPQPRPNEDRMTRVTRGQLRERGFAHAAGFRLQQLEAARVSPRYQHAGLPVIEQHHGRQRERGDFLQRTPDELCRQAGAGGRTDEQVGSQPFVGYGKPGGERIGGPGFAEQSGQVREAREQWIARATCIRRDIPALPDGGCCLHLRDRRAFPAGLRRQVSIRMAAAATSQGTAENRRIQRALISHVGGGADLARAMSARRASTE
jgi:hypothetical protein